MPVERNRGNNDSGLRRGDVPAGGEATPRPAPGSDNWRGRAVGRRDDASASPAPSGTSGSRDVPRRIIDGIGGAHIFHGETPGGGSSSSTRTRDTGRDAGRGSERSSAPPPSHSEPSHVDRSSASHDSGSHNDGGSKSKKD